jgi:Rho termination factor, N-terminal domain
MAASSRPQPQRNGRSLPRRILDTIRVTLGRGRATLGRMRPINRPRGQAPRQADAVGKHTPGRLRHLRQRSVAGTRHFTGHSVTTVRSLPARVGRQLSRLARRGRGMAGQIDTIPGTGQPVEPARNLTKAAAPSAGRAANRRPGAAERAAPAGGRQVAPAKGRGTPRQASQRQAKPRQAKRRQDLEHQTMRQLREWAREAGVQGRSSMTKVQLIKALREHR